MEPTISPPPYREAYPCFDVVTAEAECDRGREICTFKRANGSTIGFCSVARSDERSVTLLCEFAWSHCYHPRGEVTFSMRRERRGIHEGRPMLLCPGCGAPKAKIFYKDPNWACGDCHKLRFRCQLLDPRVRAWERMAQLSQAIRGGRPHRMRQATYAGIKAELAALKKQLRGLPPLKASREHTQLITTIWRTREDSADDLRDWNY